MKLAGFILIAWLIACCVFAAPMPDLVCAGCHKAQFEAQARTPMASALVSASECEILREHPDLSFSAGVYSYRIVRQGNASLYRVSDGTQTITVPLLWAFGRGAAGQTYVFERNGYWVESRVSYFRSINGLDLTMGAAGSLPSNLEQAAGRIMNAKDSAECFACHATRAIAGTQVDVTHLTAGIHCERCHEGAQEHAAALQRGGRSDAMPKLIQSSAEEMSNFCGQCHRTWAQIASDGPFGIGNIRFQPYRLTNSRCYDASDRRISCTACHEPHGQGTASYDAKCLACHGAQAKRCPVGKADCSGCHMPKLELPGSHHQFTDHQIRVVRAGEKYPN